MIFSFVLIDLTTNVTPDAMRPALAFESLIAAWTEQLSTDWADVWGTPNASFRIGTPEDRECGEIAIHFRDTIPEAPQALAYHQVTSGVPDIEMGVDLFSSLLDGQDSLSCGGSHEILETVLNPGANGWKDRQDGSGESDAEEACDKVQNTGYAKRSGDPWLSNFLRPEAFIPGALPPYDFLGVMASQQDVTNGYAIVATSPVELPVGHARTTMTAPSRNPNGKALACRGILTRAQAARKSHPYSRASRRGATRALQDARTTEP